MGFEKARKNNNADTSESKLLFKPHAAQGTMVVQPSVPGTRTSAAGKTAVDFGLMMEKSQM